MILPSYKIVSLVVNKTLILNEFHVMLKQYTVPFLKSHPERAFTLGDQIILKNFSYSKL